MNDQATGREIIISTPSTRYEVAAPIPLTVTYVNHGPERVTFCEPAKTWEVQLAVRDQSDNETVESFGRILLYRGEDHERTSLEPAEDITLDRGERHEFTSDIAERWIELFGPGTYLVRVLDKTDDAETLASNPLQLRIVFTPDSLSRLLDIAADTEATVDARQFAADWIRRFYGQITLHTQEPTAKQEAANQATIAKVRTWWQSNRQTREVQQKIIDINKAADARPGQG